MGYQEEGDIMLILFDAIGCHSLRCIFCWIVCLVLHVASDAAAMDVVTTDAVMTDATTMEAAMTDTAAMDVVIMTVMVIHAEMMETLDVVAARVSGGCVFVGGGGLPFELLDLMFARGQCLRISLSYQSPS
jgi:hypothetical protein